MQKLHFIKNLKYIMKKITHTGLDIEGIIQEIIDVKINM